MLMSFGLRPHVMQSHLQMRAAFDVTTQVMFFHFQMGDASWGEVTPGWVTSWDDAACWAVVTCDAMAFWPSSTYDGFTGSHCKIGVLYELMVHMEDSTLTWDVSDSCKLDSFKKLQTAFTKSTPNGLDFSVTCTYILSLAVIYDTLIIPTLGLYFFLVCRFEGSILWKTCFIPWNLYHCDICCWYKAI